MPSLERQARDAENRALRQWAADQGIDVPPAGRIPAEVREAFAAAGGVEALAAAAADVVDDDTPPGPVPSGFFMPPPPDDPPPPPPGGKASGGGGSTSSSGGRKKSSGLAQIQEDLAGGLRIFGAGAMYVSPIAGRCVVDDADPVSVEIIRLGEQYPKFGEFLLEAAKVAPPLKLGKYGARWAVAAAVDRGRIAVDSMPSRIFGVEEVAQQLVESGVIVISDEPPKPRGSEQPAAA